VASPPIVAEGFRKAYDVVAVDGIDFTVSEGEIFGLLGPSRGVGCAVVPVGSAGGGPARAGGLGRAGAAAVRGRGCCC